MPGTIWCWMMCSVKLYDTYSRYDTFQDCSDSTCGNGYSLVVMTVYNAFFASGWTSPAWHTSPSRPVWHTGLLGAAIGFWVKTLDRTWLLYFFWVLISWSVAIQTEASFGIGTMSLNHRSKAIHGRRWRPSEFCTWRWSVKTRTDLANRSQLPVSYYSRACDLLRLAWYRFEKQEWEKKQFPFVHILGPRPCEPA